MGLIKHTCVKPGCGNEYEDDDVDDYYCLSCIEEKDRIAKEIDEKVSRIPKKEVKSDLQLFDEISKRRRMKGGVIPIKDLGINW